MSYDSEMSNYSDAPLLRRVEKIWAPFYILIFFLFQLRKINDGLVDMYGFRQTQTTWGVREVITNGIDFLHLRMPVLGPPWQTPFEFPLFQNVAGLVGLSLDLSPSASGRLTSLIFYSLATYVGFNITSLWFGKLASYLFLLIFTLTPFALQWSVASLIESCAVFFLLLSAFSFEKYCSSNKTMYILLFGASLALTSLTKITTAVPAILIYVGFSLYRHKLLKRSSILFFTFLMFFLSLVPTYFWTHHADQIKSENIWASWLTSDNLKIWNFGTIDQRLDFSNWERISYVLSVLVGVSAIFLIPILILQISNRVRFVFLLFGALMTPLVFFNLYVVHDYYFMAISPLISIAIAGIFSEASDNFGKIAKFNLTPVAVFMAMTFLSSWFISSLNGYPANIKSNHAYVPPLSISIKENSLPTDRVLIVGCDWDPTILYYADRYGLSSPGVFGNVEQVLDKLQKANLLFDYKLLGVCGDSVLPKLNGVFFETLTNDLYRINKP
jgi:hypothetical protein